MICLHNTQSTCLILLVVLALLHVGNAVSICSNPEAFAGKSWCDQSGGYCGECVSFVKRCTGDRRPTSQWRPGAKVVGSSLQRGTAIATFVNGKYQSAYGGTSHAAIFEAFTPNGIIVWDQYKGKTVGKSTIRWSGKTLEKSANSYYIIE